MADHGGSSSQEIAGSSNSTFEINVKTLDSRIYKFPVTKNMPVLTLKAKISNATGTPVEQQRLIFRGKVLKDDKLVSDYHLEDGHTLHLVARQPAPAQPEPGTASGDPSHVSVNQGHDSGSNAPRSRVGQVSHSVVVGTVNVADQGEGVITDISRVVGAVLQSIGAGMVVPSARTNNMTTSSNQDPPNGETDGLQNASSRTQQGDMAQPTVPVGNQPFQIPLFSTGPMPWNMGISDSLTTLVDFINRMELILQNSGSQSSAQSNVQNPSRSENPSPQPNGVPTPDMLCSVIDRARQLLSGATAASLANVTERIRQENSSSDPRVRSQVQAEAVNMGVVMQHLGSLLLELGRTTMMLRMGSSPGQSFVNAGPAVYISLMGPNPIMVQPFPTQASSLFTASSPSVSGHSGPPGAADLQRNINVHILSGSPLTAGASTVMSNSRPGNNAESHGVEQTNQAANMSGNRAPRQGMPARTVVAAVPGRSGDETPNHALGVAYPVHVLSQQSVSIPLAVPQGLRPSGTGGAQSNAPVLQNSFLESGSIPAIVAQINSSISNMLAGNASGNFSSSSTMQSSNTHSSQPITDDGSQSSIASSVQALSGNSEGQNLTPMNIMSSSASVPQLVASGSSSSSANENTGISLIDSVAEVGYQGNNHEVESHLDTCFQSGNGNQTKKEGHEFVHTPDHDRSIDLAGTSSNSSVSLSRSQAGDTGPTASLECSGQNMIPTSVSHGSSSSQHEESQKPMPVGLGLGGLQLKKRSKSTKSVQKGNTSAELSSNKPNQESIARGQEVLQSLFPHSSDADVARLNGSSGSNSSFVNRIMDGISSGGGSSGQADIGSMMSSVLRNPAFNSLLTNVAEQTGLGSPADLRSMMEQCTRSPAIRNTLNDIVQQAEGHDQGLRPMLFGSGRGEGGVDFSRMIQQLMPVVSQAFGRVSTDSVSSGSEPQHLSNHMPDQNYGIHDQAFQVDLCKAREGIEQHDPPADIFSSVLDGVQQMYPESNDYRELIEVLGNDVELSNEYAEILRRDLRHRLEKQPGNEERS